MDVNLDRLGLWTEWHTYRVDRETVATYAAAINDGHERHLSGEVAPPMFAVVPITQPIIEAQTAATPLYEKDLSLHGEHDLVLHGRIEPGTEIGTRAAFVGVQPTSSGVVLLIRIQSRSGMGELLNEQYLSSFYRGESFDGERGEKAPPLPTSTIAHDEYPLARRTQQIHDDQSIRYAHATGDRGAYHLDDEAAREVDLPGIILHGLCSMAFTSHAVINVVCGGNADRLRRLAVRFTKPVRPGQQLTTTIWAAGQGGTAFVFEASDPEGDRVIRNGYAEIHA